MSGGVVLRADGLPVSVALAGVGLVPLSQGSIGAGLAWRVKDQLWETWTLLTVVVKNSRSAKVVTRQQIGMLYCESGCQVVGPSRQIFNILVHSVIEYLFYNIPCKGDMSW